MSGSLPPLADISLEEASKIRGELLRAIMGGQLSVRLPDGTAVTYRSMDEMKAALAEIDVRIAAATSAITGVTNPMLRPVRAFRFTPWNGLR